MEKYRLFVCPVDSLLRLSALQSFLSLSLASPTGLGWRLETAFDLQCVQLSVLLVQKYRFKVKATSLWDCRHEDFTSEFGAAEAAISRHFPTAAIEKFPCAETIEEFKRRVDSAVCSPVQDSVVCVVPVEVMARVAARLHRKEIPVFITQGRGEETCVEVSQMEFHYATEGKSLWESTNTLFFQPLFAGYMETGISLDPIKGLLIDYNKPKSALLSAVKALLITLEPAVNIKLKELQRRPLFHTRFLASLTALWSDFEQLLKDIMAKFETRDLDVVSSSISKLETRKQEIDSAKQFLPSKVTCQNLQSAIRTVQDDLQVWRQETARVALNLQQEVAETEARVTALEEALRAKLPQSSSIQMKFRNVLETTVELEISSNVDVESADLVTALAPNRVHICLPRLQIRKGIQVTYAPKYNTASAQSYVITQGSKWLSNLVIVPSDAYITPQ